MPFAKKFRSESEIKYFHVHVYYDGSNKQLAGHLRREVGARFKAELGRWRDKAIGPHPQSSFQITVGHDEFADLTSFLALNRGNLHMLLHPNTGDGVRDHTVNAMWIGPSIPLNDKWMERNKKRLNEISAEMVAGL